MMRVAFSLSRQILHHTSRQSFSNSTTGPYTIHPPLLASPFLIKRPIVKMEAQNQPTVELPPNLKKIVTSFQMVPDPMARYKQLLFFASKLDPLPSEFHTEENRVQGCVSQVWVKATFVDGRLDFKADSDSQLTKGLAALLVQGLSGCTPQEILTIQPDFIEMLGLKQSLTPSRNNGFLNMFKLMQKRTLQLAAADLNSQDHHHPPKENSGNGESSNASLTPVEDAIHEKLTKGLQPKELVIVNESRQHAGHMGNPNNDPETHFKLKIVTSHFSGISPVKRHRMVFALLEEELAGPVHALSLDTKSPEEI